ncbi:MAG: sulfotransferase domain-containing protein [Saprospiraceae bacterium]
MMLNHVLILGCGRSGTSIFGEFFEHLPCYTYHSEPPYATLKTWSYATPTAIKVPKVSAAYPPSPGLSFPLADLLASIPDPKKIYWQIRHPLDTICSLKVGISRNWGHHPRPEDWQDWRSRPLIEQCAHHWNYLNTVGYQQVAHLVTVSRFENMIADPLGFAENIAQEIGLESPPYHSEIKDWARRVQNTNNENFIEAKTSRPYSTNDHNVKVGRWKENLSPEEIESIMPIIRQTMTQFGYSTITP